MTTARPNKLICVVEMSQQSNLYYFFSNWDDFTATARPIFLLIAGIMVGVAMSTRLPITITADGGYENVLIVIQEDILEDPDLVAKLKVSNSHSW